MATYYFRNANGNWGAAASWSITSGGPANGAVPTVLDDAYFDSNSGSCTFNTTGFVCKTLICSGVGPGNYIGTFTFTNGVVVSGNITLSSGMTITGSGILTANITSTFTSNGKTWPAGLTFAGNSTFTLADNLTVTGPISLSGSNLNINSNTLYIGNNLTHTTATSVVGTTNFIFNGTGTWSHTSTGLIQNNVTISATAILTIGTSVYWGGTTGNSLINIGGIVITTGSTLYLAGSTTGVSTIINVDSNGIIWNNITVTSGTFVGTINLLSDLYFSGTLVNGNATTGTVVNGSTIYCISGRLDGFGNGSSLGGTSTLIFKGNSTWYTLYSGFSLGFNIIIDCERLGLSPSGTVGYHYGSTVTYVRGSFNKTDTFRISGNTLINFHKAPLYTVICNNSSTITMNEFFSGSPNRIVSISSSGVTNYTIAFQDGFEKISKFVNINNCTLSKPQQLLVITNSPRSSTNTRGIRYINQSPNGIAKGKPSINAPMTFGAGGLLSDPNMR